MRLGPDQSIIIHINFVVLWMWINWQIAIYFGPDVEVPSSRFSEACSLINYSSGIAKTSHLSLSEVVSGKIVYIFSSSLVFMNCLNNSCTLFLKNWPLVLILKVFCCIFQGGVYCLRLEPTRSCPQRWRWGAVQVSCWQLESWSQRVWIRWSWNFALHRHLWAGLQGRQVPLDRPQGRRQQGLLKSHLSVSDRHFERLSEVISAFVFCLYFKTALVN